MKQKVTIFQRRDWEKETLDGRVSKSFYACFPEKGKPFEFQTSSDREHEVYEGASKFEPNHSEEIEVSPKFNSFRQEMKWIEVGSEGE